MIQDKAQSAVKGCSLNKGCNAALNHLWTSLRARREAVIPRGHKIRGVAFLEKGKPFSTERALQLVCPLGMFFFRE